MCRQGCDIPPTSISRAMDQGTTWWYTFPCVKSQSEDESPGACHNIMAVKLRSNSSWHGGRPRACTEQWCKHGCLIGNIAQ
jgi:hypothetical protein